MEKIGRQQKKEEIKHAAVKVMGREGFYAATTDKIALEAKVAVGTIYNYFKNKEEILTFIFESEYSKREDFFNIIQGTGLGPLDKIRAILNMTFSEVNKNSHVVKIMIEEKHRYWKYTRDGYDRQTGLRNQLGSILAHGVSTGDIKDCNPIIMSLLLTGAMESAMQEALRRRANGDDYTIFLESSVEQIVSLLKLK